MRYKAAPMATSASRRNMPTSSAAGESGHLMHCPTDLKKPFAQEAQRNMGGSDA
jgi:hypothetical protein